jgi:hypothetical protein
MRLSIRQFVCGLLGLAALLPILAAAAESGLLSQISGAVTYRTADTGPLNASVFMKLREGDKLLVAPGASARVVYFSSGRQELWQGPAEFTVGEAASFAAKGTPQLTQLPVAVGRQFLQSPDLALLARQTRPASVTVRGFKPPPTVEQGAAVQQARDAYAAMAASAAPDDVTPELYLLAVLMDHGLREEMGKVLDTMQAKQPANDSIAALKQRLGPPPAKSPAP